MEQFSVGDRIITNRSDYVEGSNHVGTVTKVLSYLSVMVRYDHLSYSVHEFAPGCHKLSPIEELAISQGRK